MNKLVQISDGKVTVNSKDVADKFNKNHRDVLRAIKNIECSQSFRERNFALSSYVSEQGKSLPCVDMARDGFCFLVMGFTGKDAAEWKEKYIEAFNSMENYIRNEAKGMMDICNDAVKLMEHDKDIASAMGKGLSEWKDIKKGHEDKIKKLMSDAQMLLGFK